MTNVNKIGDIFEVVVEFPKLNVFESEPFKTDVLQLNKDGQSINLLINMSEVTFIDSSGFAALLGIAKSIERSGGQLILCEVRPAVLRLFEILQLHRTLCIVTDRETALKSFK